MEIKHILLYRGVNETKFLKDKGELIPHGTKFTFTPKFGDFQNGEGFQFGETTRNAILAHHKNSKIYLTSGISTTPHYERAKYYALNGNNNKKFDKGFVYVIAVLELDKNEVHYYDVNDSGFFPKQNKDDEIILVSKNNSILPSKIILRIDTINRKIIKSKNITITS